MPAFKKYNNISPLGVTPHSDRFNAVGVLAPESTADATARPTSTQRLERRAAAVFCLVTQLLLDA
jgi:hypothetical protein